MRKIFFNVLVALTVVSCKKEHNDFVTFSGKIDHKNSNTLTVFSPTTGYKKIINVDEDGIFKDTLKVTSGFFFVSDRVERTRVFFKNGDDITMTIDTKQFDETVKFKGKGAEESNYLAKIALAQEGLITDEQLFKLSKTNFDTKINSFITEFTNDLNDKRLDTAFTSMQKKGMDGFKEFINKMYVNKHYISTVLTSGKPSPKFIDYENFKGGKTSLDDLKGKYVYIDMWATWCQPCKAEIPYLQKVEKKFHGKNIKFVSISVDTPEDHDIWKKMVADLKLTGIQLFSDKKQTFANAYKVNSIPRFILLDPNGNIVDANAPRPSDSELVKLLNTLKI